MKEPDIITVTKEINDIYFVSSKYLGTIGLFLRAEKSGRYVFKQAKKIEYLKGWYMAQILTHLNYLNGLGDKQDD